MSDAAHARTFRREWMILLFILSASALLRAAILFTGQQHLRSDEAVVGIMAKHIVERGERPVFLYGQYYGGGHAIEAYIAAPFFKWFGASGFLLTAVPATLSLVSILLVWLIARRLFGFPAAHWIAALYAFSPPVVYQAFLVNGGTESFLLALTALWLFVNQAYKDDMRPAFAVAVGLLCGLAYYAMDYALLYPIVFTVVLLLLPHRRRSFWFLSMSAGFLIGCLPIIIFNLRHDFIHLRQMFLATGAGMGLLPHVASALSGIFTGDLASYLGGEIDDFVGIGLVELALSYVVIFAVAALAWRNRDWFARRFRKERIAPAPEILLLAFVLIYIAIYLVAKFSLPELRTPRYFLPLSPFIEMAVALVLLSAKTISGKRIAAATLCALALIGAWRSLDIGMRPWHEEHRIRTSGREMKQLAQFVKEQQIKYAIAPYEIQWRLMFEADESIKVSCAGISPLSRYPVYDSEVSEAVMRNGRPSAFIFRKDFAFAEWAAERGMGGVTKEDFERECKAAGINPNGTPVGNEFVVYFPVYLNEEGRFSAFR